MGTSLFLILVGLVTLTVGAEVLVRGAARLAVAAGVTPLVIGLTVVAFGTSAPELGASVAAALTGKGDIAFGNVVGSNIFNVLFILGVSAILCPLAVNRKLVRFDVPVMIGASVLAALLAADGKLARGEGLLLLAGLAAYVFHAVRSGREEPVPDRERESSSVAGADRAGSTGTSAGLVMAGLVLLVLGSRWLVQGAVALATLLGVDELVIGLTIVAVGTSLPEVVTSLVAALRSQRDIAVGNVVGSNIFNILGVLGAASSASGHLAVSPAAMRFDVPVMLASSAACLPIFFTGYRIARWEGFLLLGFYVAYLGYLVLHATHHSLADDVGWAMAGFVVPLATVTLCVVSWRELRRGREPRLEELTDS